MAKNRFTKNLNPERPHLAKGEVGDLRRDIYEAFAALADALDTGAGAPYVDISTDVDAQTAGSPIVVTIQLLDGPGGDSVSLIAKLALTAFGDVDTVNASGASILTALGVPVGDLLNGTGTAAIYLRTDATGKFQANLDSGIAANIWLGVGPDFGSPSLNYTAIKPVTFTP